MWWVAVFAFAQIADVVTTILVLRAGGYEKNPIVRYLQGLGGPIWIAVKFAAAALAAYILHRYDLTEMLGLIAAVVGFVALRNWRWYQDHKQ